jgi:hypothetical protein
MNGNKIDALNEAKAVVEAKETLDDDDVTQVKAAIESISRLEQEMLDLSQLYTQKKEEIRQKEGNMKTLMANPILIQLANQEAALARKAEAYPQRLARHKRRCATHGFSDSSTRSGGKK